MLPEAVSALHVLPACAGSAWLALSPALAWHRSQRSGEPGIRLAGPVASERLRQPAVFRRERSQAGPTPLPVAGRLSRPFPDFIAVQRCVSELLTHTANMDANCWPVNETRQFVRCRFSYFANGYRYAFAFGHDELPDNIR
jgi:hypothetical protein